MFCWIFQLTLSRATLCEFEIVVDVPGGVEAYAGQEPLQGEEAALDVADDVGGHAGPQSTQPRGQPEGRAAKKMLAAIDLGSNSFHMVIARRLADSLQIVDRIKERVRLAAGLDASKRLTPEAQERALACLERFGQRLADMPRGTVRAVGTNTLRRAKNARAFLAEAQHRLGHAIEVVSGQEEARLVYLGVAHSLGDEAGRRLVRADAGAAPRAAPGRPAAADRRGPGALRQRSGRLPRDGQARGRVRFGG